MVIEAVALVDHRGRFAGDGREGARGAGRGRRSRDCSGIIHVLVRGGVVRERQALPVRWSLGRDVGGARGRKGALLGGGGGLLLSVGRRI